MQTINHAKLTSDVAHHIAADADAIAHAACARADAVRHQRDIILTLIREA